MKIIKPLGNSSRNTVLIDYREKLTPHPPQIPNYLLKIRKKHAGRNNQGRITVRHHGGEHKRFNRVIDFKRYQNDGKEGAVRAIMYNPNSNAFLALVHYEKDNNFTFIIAPEDLKVGDRIRSGIGEDIPIRIGNNLPLSLIPSHFPIHNIELKPKKGGQLARSAGTYATIIGEVGKDGRVPVKLKSGVIYRILEECRATIGKVGNSEVNQVRLGKGGRSRWRGIRPTVRGSAMNPVDHPHGGGEQKAGIGHPSPLSPWGKKTLGKKTRKKNKLSNKYIKRVKS